MSKIVYSSTVTAVGELVPEFREQGILVFFGEGAPVELHEFSILHKVEIAERAAKEGDIVRLDSEEFEVLAVGHVASDNLLNLGHLDLKANGETKADLPGDVNVVKKEFPSIKPGDKLQIIEK